MVMCWWSSPHMKLRPGIKIILIRNTDMTWNAWIDNGRQYPEHSVGGFTTANEGVDVLLEKIEQKEDA